MKTFSTVPGKERSRLIPCPLCGSIDLEPRYSIEEAEYMSCRGCGLVFQNPMPLSEELLGRYADEYFDYEIENEANFFSLMLQTLSDVDFEEIERVTREPKRFLDVGCATGMLIEYVKGRGWDEKGIEVCSPAAEYGRRERKVDIINTSLEEARFPAEYFSVVHFSHLIEHIPNPVRFMDEVVKITAPGGRCIVTTPNIRGFQSRLMGSKWRSAIPDHVVLYSKKTLRRLLEEAGLRVEKTKTWGGLAAGLAPPGVKRIADRAAKLIGAGDVMVMRARKPLE